MAERKPLRSIADPFVVAPPTGARIRTRIHPTPAEQTALRAIGTHLGGLYRADLMDRFRLGRVPGAARDRTGRKRRLTGGSSSRWAGSITRAAEDQYQFGMRGLAAEVGDLRSATETIARRLAVPCGEKDGQVRGYPAEAERFQKSRRLAHLRRRLAAAERELDSGRPSVVVGGRRLWRNRQHLAESRLTEQQWRDRWAHARMFLTADGESGKRYGNETIRVTTDGVLSVKVPGPLETEFGRRLAIGQPVGFAHRCEEWAARIADNQAVRYDISYDPAKDRWYLDASWGIPAGPTPTVDNLRSGLVMAVDLNAEHLAAYVVDPSGNPVGAPHDIPIDLNGLPATTRAGRLKSAIAELLNLAAANGCTAVAIENLNFTDARTTGRETMGRGRRGKTFRRTVAGIPTAQFRTWLTSMAANRGVWIIAVDPAYTSQWGAQHWRKPLQQQASGTTVTRHNAAAVAIGRRAHGLAIKRRVCGPRNGQRTAAGQPTPRLDRQAMSGGCRTPRPTDAPPKAPGPADRDDIQLPRPFGEQVITRPTSAHS